MNYVGDFVMFYKYMKSCVDTQNSKLINFEEGNVLLPSES